MKPTGLYPMIATEMLAESRDFYVGLGFAVAYDGDWYVHMAWPTNPTLQIGFITAGHPSQAPIYRTWLSGGGVFLGLEVDDVDDVYRDLTSRGHAITVTLKDGPWASAISASPTPTASRSTSTRRSRRPASSRRPNRQRPSRPWRAPDATTHSEDRA